MENVNSQNDEKEHFRRKYPRREFERKIGIICGGVYFISEGKEIGEGGLAFFSDMLLEVGNSVVVNMQIPHGDFISERALIKTRGDKNPAGQLEYGLSFERIGFSRKRQIRSYVSAR